MTKSKLPKLHSDFSIDCVIFGFDDGELKILLIERNEAPFNGWKAIPGNLVYDNENIDQAAERILYELTGLKNVYLEQFQTFGDINRHPQGRVITVAYYSIIKRTDSGLHPVTSFAKKAFWWPTDSIPKLSFDHNKIVERALEQIKHKISFEPIGFELLPPKFTLTQLQHVYESILQKQIDKRNFRKKILSFGFLKEYAKKQTGVSHRAAKLYRFDKNKYELLRKKGFSFEI